MTTTVTVYGKPACVMCDATKRHLDKKGIAYTYLQLEDHPRVVDLARASGHLQAPFVVVERGSERRMWGGYRYALIEELPYLIKEK